MQTSVDHEPVLNDAERAEAKRYGRLHLAAGLADKALDLIVLAVAVWLAPAVDGWLAAHAWAEPRYVRLAAMLVILGTGGGLVSFPLAFYSGFVLEHQFGLSRLTFRAWLWRYAKGGLLAAGFGLLLVLGLYAMIWNLGAWWWSAAAAGFFLVSVVLGQLVPVLILPLFYKIAPLERPELAERLARLAEGTGLTLGGVFRIALSEATSKANAMLAGLGRTRRVLLGDTLLDEFSPREIDVIFAHELGHHVYRHLRKSMVAGVIYSTVGFWICDRLLLAWAGQGVARAELPVSSLPVVILALSVFSLLLEPLQNSLSRHFERQSDRYALVRTDDAEAYRAAFEKLARQNKADPDPPWLEVFLFHSHPPIAERLAMAEGHGSP